METRKLPKKLAKALAESGIDLNGRDRVKDAASVLVNAGLVEDYKGLWRDISSQLIEPAKEIQAKLVASRRANKKTLANSIAQRLGLSSITKVTNEQLQELGQAKRLSAAMREGIRDILLQRVRRKNRQAYQARKQAQAGQKYAELDERIRAGKIDDIYYGSDAVATKRLNKYLASLGTGGQIAALMLSAQKASSRAKAYHGEYRGLSYDRKGQALESLCDQLDADSAGLVWGWGADDDMPFAPHVLYIDLPTGQVSWHSTEEYAGPQYEGQWDGVRGVTEARILRYAASQMLSLAANNN